MSAAGDRQATILAHHALVRSVAARLARRLPPHVDVDELVNIGVLGLIDAVDRFDEARGVPFPSYAEIRIRGAILDALRETDWVPSAVRRRFARLDAARAALQARLGRQPEREEVARALDLSPEEYDDLCESAEIRKLVPLGDDEDAGPAPAALVSEARDSTLEQAIASEERAHLEGAIARLPDRERLVVTLYYLQGLSLREIGKTLGVSEARACQLRGQAVGRLQHALLPRQRRSG